MAEKKEEQKVSPSPLVIVPSATPTTPQSICVWGGRVAGVGGCLQAKHEIYLLYRVNQLPEGQGSGVPVVRRSKYILGEVWKSYSKQ